MFFEFNSLVIENHKIYLYIWQPFKQYFKKSRNIIDWKPHLQNKIIAYQQTWIRFMKIKTKASLKFKKINKFKDEWIIFWTQKCDGILKSDGFAKIRLCAQNSDSLTRLSDDSRAVAKVCWCYTQKSEGFNSTQKHNYCSPFPTTTTVKL